MPKHRGQAPSMKYQLKATIDFKIGRSKREEKAEERKNGVTMSNKVYSIAEAKALEKMSNQLGTYIKENYPEIKYARDIRAEHVQSFLDRKVSEGCRPTTIKHYDNLLRKMSLGINQTYGARTDWTSIRVPTPSADVRLRQDAMTQYQYNEVLKQCDRRCESLNGLELCRAFGLRSNSVEVIRARDVDLRGNTLTITRDKGGRERILPIETREQRELLSRLTNGKSRSELLVKVKGESVDKYLKEKMRASGECKNLLAQKTGIHSIRKMVAQERYDRLRNEGYTSERAKDEVSNYLGHGDGRMDIANIYIACQW